MAVLILSLIGSIIKVWVDRTMRPIDKRWGQLASRSIGTLSLFLTIVVFLMLIPAAIFSVAEDWTYLESVYYTVATLTTVGFGNFVPGRFGVGGLSTGLYRVMAGFWLWIGLSLMAALVLEMKVFLESLWKAYVGLVGKCCSSGGSRRCGTCGGTCGSCNSQRGEKLQEIDPPVTVIKDDF